MIESLFCWRKRTRRCLMLLPEMPELLPGLPVLLPVTQAKKVARKRAGERERPAKIERKKPNWLLKKCLLFVNVN